MTNLEQIEILTNVKNKLISKSTKDGLCILISKEIELRFSHRLSIQNYIPLFTYENACKYGDITESKGTYWWKIHPYNYESRIQFIDWIISQLTEEFGLISDKFYTCRTRRFGNYWIFQKKSGEYQTSCNYCICEDGTYFDSRPEFITENKDIDWIRPSTEEEKNLLINKVQSETDLVWDKEMNMFKGIHTIEPNQFYYAKTEFNEWIIQIKDIIGYSQHNIIDLFCSHSLTHNITVESFNKTSHDSIHKSLIQRLATQEEIQILLDNVKKEYNLKWTGNSWETNDLLEEGEFYHVTTSKSEYIFCKRNNKFKTARYFSLNVKTKDFYTSLKSDSFSYGDIICCDYEIDKIRKATSEEKELLLSSLNLHTDYIWNDKTKKLIGVKKLEENEFYHVELDHFETWIFQKNSSCYKTGNTYCASDNYFGSTLNPIVWDDIHIICLKIATQEEKDLLISKIKAKVNRFFNEKTKKFEPILKVNEFYFCELKNGHQWIFFKNSDNYTTSCRYALNEGTLAISSLPITTIENEISFIREATPEEKNLLIEKIHSQTSLVYNGLEQNFKGLESLTLKKFYICDYNDGREAIFQLKSFLPNKFVIIDYYYTLEDYKKLSCGENPELYKARILRLATDEEVQGLINKVFSETGKVYNPEINSFEEPVLLVPECIHIGKFGNTLGLVFNDNKQLLLYDNFIYKVYSNRSEIVKCKLIPVKHEDLENGDIFIDNLVHIKELYSYNIITNQKEKTACYVFGGVNVSIFNYDSDVKLYKIVKL